MLVCQNHRLKLVEHTPSLHQAYEAANQSPRTSSDWSPVQIHSAR